MTAAMLVLDPIFEADLPSEQYAYRAGRNAQQAVIDAEETLYQGHLDVVDADLADYFGSIPHADLMRSLARRIVDSRVLHLIKMWLECAVEETDDRGRKKRTTEAKDSGRGIPQGSPITPLTQKITFSLSAVFPAGEAERSLICDAKSIILMSHGEIHAGAKGENPERGISTSLASTEHSRIGGGAVAREFDFTAPGISISRTSGSPRTTGRGGRARAADYVQNSRRCHSHPAYVCRSQRSDLERGIDTRHHGVRGACFSAWVSGVARPTFVSNTPSIDCSPPSSNESMRFSFPTVCG
jgi:hypothetical protein